MCLCYICNYNFIYFECPKGTGAKPYSRPRTLASTGAKVPVAPVESAPMDLDKESLTIAREAAMSIEL